MDVLYINLDGRTDRRDVLERNFKAHNNRQWRLNRVDAISSQIVAQRGIEGTIRATEKACFLSHIKALETARQSPGHVMIAEDDIQFGAGSQDVIEAAIRSAPEDSWDIIFADVCIADLVQMIELFQLRRNFAGGGMPSLINLSRVRFAGATAYIVNRTVKDAVLGLMPRGGPFDIAYDLFLRHAIQTGRLRAFTIFPFATTLSPEADTSQIQEPGGEMADAVLAAFRRLMWLERDMGSAIEPIERLIREGDPETLAFSKILAVLLSPQFKIK